MMDMTVEADAQFGVQAENSELAAIAARLRQAVLNAGGSKVVSQKSGVPTSTLNTYENGQDMKISKAFALAAACEVSLEWLLTGRNPGDPPPPLPARAPAALMSTVNTDRLAAAITVIDAKSPPNATARDRAVAIVALYDIILPMDDAQVASLVHQHRA